MNPALQAQWDAAAVGHAASLGVSGFYQQACDGDPIELASFVVQELSDSIAQERYGNDRSRVVQATIRATLLSGVEPVHGDTLTISDGPQAGCWVVLGVDSRTAVHLTVAARWAARFTASAPGARIVKR